MPFALIAILIMLLIELNQVYELGANAVHINFWSGLGVYKSIRELDLPIFIHFQKAEIRSLLIKAMTIISLGM